MAIAFVQSSSNYLSTNTTPITDTWSSNTTTGNFIVVSWEGHGATVSSITDSQSNTYTKAGANTAGIYNTEVWYAQNITGGTTPTITLNISSGQPSGIIIKEYSGVITTGNPIDASDFTATGTGTTATTNNITTVTANTALVATMSTQGNSSWVVGAGYSNLSTSDNINISLANEDKIVSTTGSYNATITLNSLTWDASIIALKAAPTVDQIFPSEVYPNQPLQMIKKSQYTYPTFFAPDPANFITPPTLEGSSIPGFSYSFKDIIMGY